MVGVPGRSKACHNCRQRRIKCNGERPGCYNCAKSNRICAGYQRKHAFILVKGVLTSQPKPSRDLPRLIHEADSGTVLVSRWRIDQGKPSISASTANAIPVPTFNTYTPMIQDISPRNAFREKLVSEFVGSHLRLELIDRTRGPVEQRNWLLLALDLPTLTPALEYSILALCTARLGRYNGHQALVHKSLSLYASSLRELRRAVLNPSTRYDEQNIAASMALITYEVLECPGRMLQDYMSHYNGAMKLLQLRGANAHTTGLAHSVFQALRKHSVFQCIRQRSTNFLSERNWRELPWASCPAQKGPHDHLFDILLEIPVLFNQSKALDCATTAQDILLKTLEATRECLRIEKCLTDWFANFDATVVGPLYYPQLSKMNSSADSPELGKVFPVAFDFPAFNVAQTLVFYWIALLIVHFDTYSMKEKLANLTASMDTVGNDVFCTCREGNNNSAAAMRCPFHSARDLLSSLSHTIEWSQTSARNICQSVEYFLHDQMRGEGPVSMIPALMTVRFYWRMAPGDWSREILWTDDMIGRIQGKGTELARFF